jgi:surface protein
MAIKLGNKNINKAYLGGVEIKKLYLGANVIFDNTFIPFIIEVDTSNTGVSNADQFQFTGALGDYDVVAKQNDIVVATFNDLSGQETITLPSSGVYVLEVSAKEVNGFNRIRFAFAGDKNKMTDIKQWGTIVWSNFNGAFYGCSNMLTTATDVPNLSNVTDMFRMFAQASLANPLTRDWDMSNLVRLALMFDSAISANPDTSLWDVSSVRDMNYMFRSTVVATPDTSNWDTSSVVTMFQMFRTSKAANPDTTNWNTSNVTRMDSMFENAQAANPDTSNWNTSSVTTMQSMFQGATIANPDTTNWNTSSVTTMQSMFQGATIANPDTTNWDVSSVANMSFMFSFSNLSEENLTACYENWSQLSLQQNVSFSAGNTKYNASGQAGRDILVNTYNWSIIDGGQV